MFGAQAVAAAFVESLKQYPPRQRPQSFNLVMEQLNHPAQSD
jgi:hypothetical protein